MSARAGIQPSPHAPRPDGRVAARRAGFTLIEMLVAVALMALLAGTLYGSLHVGFKARERAEAVTTPVRVVAAALGLLGEDLASTLPPGGILAGDLIGDKVIDARGRRGDVLLFHAASPAPDPEEGHGDIRRLQWGVEVPEAEGEPIRLVRDVIDDLLATEEPEPIREVVCRGVQAFELRYFDGSAWQEAWDSSIQDGALPLAIEAYLALAGPEGEEPYGLTRIYTLPCALPVEDAP